MVYNKKRINKKLVQKANLLDLLIDQKKGEIECKKRKRKRKL